MPVVVFKQIKPQRFKDEEFHRIIRNAMRRVGNRMVKDFERTTTTWESQPKFKVSTHAGHTLENPVSTEVWAESDVWNWIDKGTRPHEIWAGWYTGKSDKKVLAFPSMFTPKSVPGKLDAQAGDSGGETVFRPYVEHPGIEPRRWTEEIFKIWQPRFKAEMESAMSEFSRKSGQAM